MPKTRGGGLNDRQRVFAYEYLTDFNGTQAAIRAGYSAKGAKRHATKLLRDPRIQEIVERGKADRRQHLEITQERILDELAKIAFANALDYHRIGDNGEPIIDLSNLDEDKAAALAELQVDDYVEGRGDNSRDVRRIRFKMHDKQRALELLGKHLGIFIERHHMTLTRDPKDMTDEQLREVLERAGEL